MINKENFSLLKENDAETLLNYLDKTKDNVVFGHSFEVNPYQHEYRVTYGETFKGGYSYSSKDFASLSDAINYFILCSLQDKKGENFKELFMVNKTMTEDTLIMMATSFITNKKIKTKGVG